MQYNFSAEKGLHTDTEPVQQPKGTYRRLVNGIRTLSGAVQNEPGTDFLVELNKPILHAYVIDQQIAIFSGVADTSEIGWLKEDDTYQRILASPDLAFSLTHRLSVKSKINFKGEVVLYFTDGTSTGLRLLNTASIPTTNIGEQLRLQTYAKFPIPELVEVGEGGSVLTGVYQFVGRLLTGSGNPTSYGLVSSLIPVVNEGKTDPKQFDGAPPQSTSSKSITVEFGNIDREYKLLQIVMSAYVGTSNTPVAYVVGEVPIQGRDVVRFTYTGESQHKEQVDVSSLSISGVVIDTAEKIEEKQGVLVASNITVGKVDSTIDWQYLANLVKVNYTIKEVSTSEFGGYKDEKNAAEFKSLRRGEVYALAFAPIFRAYQDRTAYHIPAPVQSLYGNSPANTVVKTLGTYQSNLTYPTGFGYPQEFGADTSIRHHIVPTIQQEPFLTTDGSKLRILGLKVDFTQVLANLPEAVRKEIVGFAVLRQPKTPENTSILTQGIAQPHIGGGNGYSLSPFAGKAPSHNFSANYDYSRVGFLSAETTIYNQSFPEATRLDMVAELVGVQTLIAEERGADNKKIYLKNEYTTLLTNTSAAYPLKSEKTSLIPAGSEDQDAQEAIRTLSTDSTVRINTYKSYGYLYLNTQNPVNFNNELVNGKAESYYEDRANATDQFFINGVIQTSGTTKRYLFNLSRILSSQYGPVQDASYVRVGFVTSVGEVYNGDTFLSQLAVLHSSTEFAPDFKTLSYFWCESSINTNYRHYVAPIGQEGDVDYVPGTIPYFPKFESLFSTNANTPGLFNLSYSLGHGRGYNKQYSFSDNLITYNPKGFLDEQVTSFENRSVYTPTSLEGEQLDTWRLFLPTDYHDIPRTFGPITDTFVLGNTFYHHTPGALFRSFTGEAQTLNTGEETEVYLSSGIFFGRPSEPVLTVEGGYAGTQGQWGVTTPQGRYFPDTIQHKLWLFNGKFNDISKQGMVRWSEDNITRVADTNTTGYRLFYDYRNERLLFTKLGAFTYSYSSTFNSWTGEHSYLPTFGISKGSTVYLMDNTSVHQQRTAGKWGEYLNKATEPFLLSFVANEAPLNNKKFDSLILTEEVRSEAGNQLHQQTISTIQFWNDRKNTGELVTYVPTTYLDKFQLSSLYRVQADRKSEHTNITIPSDVVIDPNEDILDPANLGTDRTFSPRMTGLFVNCQLTYLNEHRYTLQSATLLSRPILR